MARCYVWADRPNGTRLGRSGQSPPAALIMIGGMCCGGECRNIFGLSRDTGLDNIAEGLLVCPSTQRIARDHISSPVLSGPCVLFVVRRLAGPEAGWQSGNVFLIRVRA